MHRDDEEMTVRAAFAIGWCLLIACAAPGARPATVAAPPLPAVAAEALPSETDAAIPIRKSNPTWGSSSASVTIVEFSDFECPYCRIVQPTLARLRDAYGPHALRIVWKNRPLEFHAHARAAAEAAMGVFALAGVDAFWRFHDLLFENQSNLSQENLEEWAKKAGLVDVDAFRAGLARQSWTSIVDADLSEGRSAGVDGTPTFFINGIPVVGAEELPTFRAIVEAQIEAARAKRAAGTPPALVYTQLANDNRASARAPSTTDAVDTRKVYRIPIGTSPTLGNPDALVTIVEFSDFQCPFCRTVEATLKSLRERYGDKLRIVWKNGPLPFHPWAEPAAQAALEVRSEKGDAAFWQMHDAIFANQPDLSEDKLEQLAAAAGARSVAVKQAIAKHLHSDPIDDDRDLAEDFEANGTPYFFVNGRRVAGAQPQAEFETMIDEEIDRAAALIATGGDPKHVYEALIENGKSAPLPEARAILTAFPAGDPARGQSSAKVTVHEWSDFQCPFCARVEPTIAGLMKDYGARIRFVWHDLPLPMHPDAPLAAQAAREALKQRGQDAFWALHDKMFINQEHLKRDNLDGYAKDLGLDMGKWRAALDDNAHADEVNADVRAAEEMGVGSTPDFLVVPSGTSVGYFLRGAQPYSRFRKLLARAFAEAK
jgi:protein-disulfide isomerase